MFLRNINQENGLYNRTRLQVNDLGKKYYFYHCYYRKIIGDKIFIPKIDLILFYSKLSFKF